MAPPTREHILERPQPLQRGAPGDHVPPRVGLGALALLTLLPRAHAQDVPTVIDANFPPPTQWSHHLPFAELPDGIRSAAFAPDRNSIYVHYTTPVFDTWGFLVAHWPEILGGALAVVSLVALLIAWRIARRRRTPGAPYCRKCNYDLTPQIARDDSGRFAKPSADTRCPECGVLLARARPVRGRRLAFRLMPVAAIWLVCAGAYASLWIARVPRDGRAARWFDLSSASLAELVSKRQWTALKKYVDEGDRVIEVDLAAGKIVRTVATRRSRTWTELAVTPDGSGVIIAGDEHGVLQLVSTRSGRRIAQVRLPERDCPLHHPRRAVIGFSPDGATAFVQWAGRETATCGVSAWNLHTGELVTVATTPSHRGAYIEARDFMLRSASPPRLASIPGFGESFQTKSFIMRRHEAEPSADRPAEFKVAPLPNPSQSRVITSDGSKAYLVAQYGRSLLRVDLNDGQTDGQLSAGPYPFDGALCLGRDDRYLVAGLHRHLAVRDTVERRWLAQLAFPHGLYGPATCISPDNRWIAAVLQAGTSGAFRHELVIWNLAEILEKTSSGAPSSDSP